MVFSWEKSKRKITLAKVQAAGAKVGTALGTGFRKTKEGFQRFGAGAVKFKAAVEQKGELMHRSYGGYRESVSQRMQNYPNQIGRKINKILGW